MLDMNFLDKEMEIRAKIALDNSDDEKMIENLLLDSPEIVNKIKLIQNSHNFDKKRNKLKKEIMKDKKLISILKSPNKDYNEISNEALEYFKQKLTPKYYIEDIDKFEFLFSIQESLRENENLH